MVEAETAAQGRTFFWVSTFLNFEIPGSQEEKGNMEPWTVTWFLSCSNIHILCFQPVRQPHFNLYRTLRAI